MGSYFSNVTEYYHNLETLEIKLPNRRRIKGRDAQLFDLLHPLEPVPERKGLSREDLQKELFGETGDRQDAILNTLFRRLRKNLVDTNLTLECNPGSPSLYSITPKK